MPPVPNVIVDPSVPASVTEFEAVNVLLFAMVNVEPVAGAVNATLLTDVAVATPIFGVVRLGLTARTGAPVPSAVVHTGNAAPPPTRICDVVPCASDCCTPAAVVPVAINAYAVVPVVRPVPPLPTATVPVTLPAVPDTLPVTSPTTLPVIVVIVADVIVPPIAPVIVGVVIEGDVARRGAPEPDAVVHTGSAAAPPPTRISVVSPAGNV